MLEILDEIRNSSFMKKIRKMTKNLRKKKIPVSWQRYDLNDVIMKLKFLEMISIALELNK